MKKKLRFTTLSGGKNYSGLGWARGPLLFALLAGATGTVAYAEGASPKIVSEKLTLATEVLQAQAVEVRGTMTDESGEPLPGVSILEKGTTNGTVTDLDGQYVLQVASSESVLVFSFIGMQNVERTVGTSGQLDIVMATDTQSLDEFVVIGYGTQRRQEITSAVASVSSEDFIQRGTRSPMELIQGKVAGLTITRTQGSNPNSGTDIQLRGLTSLT